MLGGMLSLHLNRHNHIRDGTWLAPVSHRSGVVIMPATYCHMRVFSDMFGISHLKRTSRRLCRRLVFFFFCETMWLQGLQRLHVRALRDGALGWATLASSREPRATSGRAESLAPWAVAVAAMALGR